MYSMSLFETVNVSNGTSSILPLYMKHLILDTQFFLNFLCKVRHTLHGKLRKNRVSNIFKILVVYTSEHRLLKYSFNKYTFRALLNF